MFDTLYTNCAVHANEDADTVGVRNGVIEFVGSNARESAKTTVDLAGSFVAPGFIDSHTHLLKLGLERIRTDLFSTNSKEDALERLKQASTRSKLVIAYNWDESRWPSREPLERSDIDFTSTPIIAYRRDGHMATLNTTALKLVGLETRRSGVIKEEELRLVDPLTEPDHAERKKAIEIALDIALANGITAARDNVDSATLRCHAEVTHPVSVIPMVYERELGGAIDFASWGVKVFLDGSIGSQTAAHSGWPEENLKMSKDKFEGFCRKLWNAGYRVAAHAIGEKATAVAASVFARAPLDCSIEHFELVEDSTLEALEAKSTSVSAQPNFLEWALPGGMYENRLGRDWLERNNRFRDILDRGVTLGFGSDTMPIGPAYGLHYAVNSPFSNQRISLREAIDCYSLGSAKILGLGSYRGRIKEGYRADFVIFPPDFLTDPVHIRNKEPLATVVRGTAVYVRGGDKLRGLFRVSP